MNFKNFTWVFFALFLCPTLNADTPEQLMTKVSKHCQAADKACVCYASTIEGLHMTFGNGQILKVFPTVNLSLVKGQVKSISEADNLFGSFTTEYQIEALKPYCRNYSVPGPGLNGFLQSLKYSFLDHLHYRQLENNGGFCNEYQKCTCEFSIGGNEMSPDFLNSFEIGVSGTQDYIYTGGSAGGPIQGGNFKDLFVRDLKAILNQTSVTQEKFVDGYVQQLEQYRSVCTEFDSVRIEAKRTLINLIKEIEAGPTDDPEN